MSDAFAFNVALVVLKQGGRIYRKGWNGKDMYVELQEPDEHSKMTLPYPFLKTAQGDLVPWTPSITDILSEDWLFDG